MKTKLSLVLSSTLIALLIVVGVMIGARRPVVAGVAPGQVSTATRRPSDGYTTTVYLPLVAIPPCTPTRATIYVAVNQPVFRVGDAVTAVAALVNECAHVGIPLVGLRSEPSSVLSVTSSTIPYFSSVPIGEYREVTFTLQAVSIGVVTITAGANYETLNNNVIPPTWYFDSIGSAPSVVRVLPNP